MLLILVVAVWALMLGISPGLALIAAALALIVLDRFEPALVTRLIGHEAG
jgi:hypothetical protein